MVSEDEVAAREGNLRHVATRAVVFRDRAYLCVGLKCCRMAGKALVIIIGNVVDHFAMRIMAGDAANARIGPVIAFAV